MGGCAIVDCKNRSEKGGTLRFFTFPKEEAVAQEWHKFCKLKTNIKNGRVCSIHFSSTDYDNPIRHVLMNEFPRSYRNLKLNAVPLLHVSNTHATTSSDCDSSHKGMWDVKACRSCLTVKGKLEKIGDASKRQYAAITGLQISESDGYPSYFCVECRHHIRKSLAFRRKSRRSHFVLKEIMTVRKQISYSDILTVNRKKTNLESTLNFWEPNNNSCFLVANEEGQEEVSLKKYDLEEPQTRFHSKQLVEIKPDQDTEVPVETDAAIEQEDDDEEFLPAIPDVPTNDYLEPEPELDTANLDMNDIFKDLTEKVESDNDDFVEPLVTKTAPNRLERIKVKEVLELTKYYSISTLVNSMLLYDLKVLELGQQRAVFELRKRTGLFAKALYKCAMCLTIHKDMEDLVTHVNYHNERKYGCECQVCKNKFPTEKNLNAHVANCHLYEYSCKICRATVYSQMDAVKHAKEKHSKDDPKVNIHLINRRRERKIMLSNFTITPLSQQTMGAVMLLKSRPEHNKSKERDQKPGEECPFKCDICGVGVKLRKNLERHMVLKHRYMYTCKLCKEVFTTRLQALQHNEDTHAQHKCAECGKVFGQMKTLKKHRLTHTKKVPCNLCGRSIKNEKYHFRHQVTEHGYVSINDPALGDPEYKCGTDSCGVQFANKSSLDVHLVEMNHAGAENVPYSCVPCKKMYENDEELEAHFITCRDASKYPRKCCYCTEVLRNAMEYKLHYIHKHPTLQYRYVSQNAICDICGKSIFKPMLESHLRTHSGSAYECRLCACVTGFPSAHVAHLLANHARRPYRCSLCPRRFKLRADCKDHILKIHAPTKLFKCDFCAAEFSYFRSLKEHAEKLHSLHIPPIKPKIRLKNKKIIYVYAHMKIIINDKERPIVEQLQVELIDYLEQKSKPVDCNDYFIFTPHAEEVSLCMQKRKRKKKKKEKNQTETETAVAHITIDWVDQAVKNKRIELKDENSELKDENSELKDENSELKCVISETNEELQEGEMQIDGEVHDFEIDSAKPLEVVENEGHQYVMINGEMYRIAAEDDE